MRPLAKWIGLVDKPNYRKRHQGTIPLIGGVSLFLVIFSLSDGMGSTSITVSLFVQYFCFIGDWDLDDRFDLALFKSRHSSNIGDFNDRSWEYLS